MSGPKQDRLLLTRACKTNLSQIFGLYPDPAGEVQDTAGTGGRRHDAARGDRSPGRRHRLWPVTDLALISAVAGLVGPQAAVHRRRPPSLRDGLQLSRRVGRGQGGSLPTEPSGQLRADDVHRDERPGPARAADASAVPRLAGDDFRTADRRSWATRSRRGSPARGATWPRASGTKSKPPATRGRWACTRSRRTLGAGQDHRRRPGADGRSRRRAQRRLAGAGRRHPAPPGDRHAAGRQGPAKAALCASGRRGRRRAEPSRTSSSWPPW